MPLVPVFVSSTFRDFHDERATILTTVAPLLDEALAPMGARVEVLDLRWGIDTAGLDEGAASRKVLRQCLDEIDRCRPLFVGLLGDRFGWIPDMPGLLGEVARDAGIERALPEAPRGRLSVTALEFWHGVLAAGGDAVFAVRDLLGDAPAQWGDDDPADPEGSAWLRAQVDAAVAIEPVRQRRFTNPARISGSHVAPEDLDAFARRLADELTPMVIAGA